MSVYQKELEVAIQAAKAAGTVMRQYFYANQHEVTKADGTPVTIADTTINTNVITLLAKHFPADGVIGEEESTAEYGLGRRWFCDPIDGTNAFTWGTPTAMFSLGLVVDGTPVLGVAYNPTLDFLYTAVTGDGAFCNGQPIAVNHDDLDSGVFAVPGDIPEILTRPPHLVEMADRGVKLATFSGAVCKGCLIAHGKLVGAIAPKVNAHDVAAIAVIIQEAGGMITHLDGQPLNLSKPFRGAISSNGLIHAELLAALTK